MIARQLIFNVFVISIVVPCFAQVNETKKFEYWMLKQYEGEDRINKRQALGYWLSRPDKVESYLSSPDNVEVFETA